MQYTTPTWLHLLDEWVALYISEGVNLEQFMGVTIVGGPVEQVHLAAAAPRINHYGEVVGGEVSAGCVCVCVCVRVWGGRRWVIFQAACWRRRRLGNDMHNELAQ